MYLGRVEVHEFRGLKDVEFDLAPSAKPGLVVLEGPNEAGKSTLLAFVRAILFAERGQGESLHGSVTLHDGAKSYRLERNGARSTSRLLDTQTGTRLDLAQLDRLVGNLDGNVYRNVFAFGPSELQSFDALTDGAVRERLYSAAVAGAGRNASAATAHLEAVTTELLKPRAQSVLGDLAQELAEARNGASRARSEARRYAQLASELAATGSEADSLRRDQREATATALWYEKLLQLWPDWSGRAAALDDLRRLSLEEEALNAPGAGGTPPSTWLRAAGAIRDLAADLEAYRRAKADAAELEAEQRDLVEASLNGLRSLGPEWGPPRLAAFADAGAWNARTEVARAAAAAAATALDKVEVALETARQELSAAERGLALATAKVDTWATEAGRPAHGPAADPRKALETLLARARERRLGIATLLDRFDDLNAARSRHADLLAKLQQVGERTTAALARRWVAFGLTILAAAAVAVIEWEGRPAVAGVAAALGVLLGLLLWPPRGLSAADSAVAELRANAAEASLDVGRSEAALGDARARLGLAPDAGAPEARAAAREVEDRLALYEAGSGALAALAGAKAELAHRRRAVQQLEGRAAALSAARATSTTEWEEWCRSVKAPTGATPETMPALLGRIADLQTKVARLTTVTVKLKQARASARTFETRTKALAAEVGRPFDGLGPSVAVGEWLQAAASAEALEADLAEKRGRMTNLIGAGQQKLETLFGSRAAEAATALDERDPQAWEQGLTQWRARAEDLERQADGLTRRTGALKQTLDDLGRSADLPGYLAALESSGNSARLEARRWLVARLAKDLISSTRAAYEREKVPEVLRRTGHHLAEVTGGRYVRVHLGDDGALRAFTPADEPSEVGTLSRGTQEQLYLAIRFGLVESFSSGHAAMPLVLDEVMVNADPERAERLARSLVELARRHQLLYLTCHPETARLLVGSAPSGAVHIRLAGTRTVQTVRPPGG